MSKLDCYNYCDWGPYQNNTFLFGYSEPRDDYFNDNLDLYFDEDDYYDYTDHPEQKPPYLEDKEYFYSHPTAH